MDKWLNQPNLIIYKQLVSMTKIKLGSSKAEFEFPVRMTEYQFRSFARRIHHSDAKSELKQLERVTETNVEKIVIQLRFKSG